MTRVSDFDYHLPPGLIAQAPLPQRDASRMMVVHRPSGEIEDRCFRDFPSFLDRGDVVVVNDSRVIPARLEARRETGARIEVLLLRRPDGEGITDEGEVWECLLKPARRLREGERLTFGAGAEGRILERLSDKKWRLGIATDRPLATFLEERGLPPLPPYIKRKGASGKEEDLVRYQTVYARRPGSVAAPTAGLHFSPAVLQEIAARNVPVVSVTLHVGYGTFSPIEVEEIEDHVMDAEPFEMPTAAAERINAARRVVAVGTTSCRVLETAADERGHIEARSGVTSLYIFPGYRFKRVGALLTNFHLPRSSLYLLVCAFAGKELMEKAYRRAVEKRYRFYSYGDCMLIL